MATKILYLKPSDSDLHECVFNELTNSLKAFILNSSLQRSNKNKTQKRKTILAFFICFD